MKKLFTKLRSINVITYIFAAMLIFLLLFGPLEPYELAIGWGFNPIENPVLAQIIGYANIALIIAGAIIVYAIIFPLLRLILRRIGAYISIFFVCIRSGAKMKLKRLPLASLLRVSAKGDIYIKANGESIHVHFIDVVGRARIFTLIDDKKYDICKTVPDRIKGFAFGFRAGGVMVANSKPYKSRSFSFPDFQEKDGKHIIVIDPAPMEIRYVDGSVTRHLYSAYSIGNIVFYELSDLLKLLKRI